MRYFTRGWAEWELPEEAMDAVRNAYWKYIENLLPTMPPAVARLTKTRLHDAEISRVVLDHPLKTLTLVLVVSGSRSFFEVTLTYQGVEMGGRYLEAFKAIARDRETCILYDEIDVDADGEWVHRLLFSPDGEMNIWFRKLTLKKTKMADDRVSLKPCFLEIHDEND